jgi:hypothetical protein
MAPAEATRGPIQEARAQSDRGDIITEDQVE